MTRLGSRVDEARRVGDTPLPLDCKFSSSESWPSVHPIPNGQGRTRPVHLQHVVLGVRAHRESVSASTQRGRQDDRDVVIEPFMSEKPLASMIS